MTTQAIGTRRSLSVQVLGSAVFTVLGALLVALASASPPQRAEGRAATGDLVEQVAGGIVGSKHDFTQGGGSTRDLCLPCHGPHITAAEAPLLMQRSSGVQRPRAYGARGVELSAASLLCLSCHDGTVATDVLAGPHAMTWTERNAAGARGGLTSHPVGTPYPAARDGYASSAAVVAAGLPLADGRLQCTTCHDPHNTGGHAGLLVISNQRSRLCLTCHRL